MQKNGFTLVELLIYTAIFVVISLVLIYFLTLFFRVSQTQASSAEVANQANFILQKIQNEIAGASFLAVNDDGNDETDAFPLSQPYGKLVIKDRAETTADANDTKSPIMIYKNGGDVVMRRGAQQE